MTRQTSEHIAGLLEQARRELQQLARHSDQQIEGLSRGFQQLASFTQQTSSLAAATVDRLESESVRSVLPKVQALGITARAIFEERLNATTGILSAIESEARLLRQFSLVTRRQASIALKTSVLTMYTNIEVGRLGSEGAGFQHLAETLSAFSKSLTADTEELVLHIDSRKPALEATRRALSAEVPHLQAEFVRIDAGLEADTAALQAGLDQLTEAPVQFRLSLDDIAQQVAQVVSAVQAHDITRQQLEHVEEALTQSATAIRRPRPADLARAYATIKVQLYQLQNIKATVAQWTTQIRDCTRVIMNISASGIAGISPLVLAQEREVAARLAHINQLQSEGRGCTERIRSNVGSRSALLNLVAEHTETSRSVRHQLHLLSLNSIIEATRLGSQADAVFELAKSISDISTDWGKVTAQSEAAMQEILELVTQTSGMMQIFSDDGHEHLAAAEAQTRIGLADLHTTASFAAQQASELQAITTTMQSTSTAVDAQSHALDVTYAIVDNVLESLETLKQQLKHESPSASTSINPAEIEHLLSPSYTTGIERDILHAALHGQPLPIAQEVFTGNSVELF